MLVQKANLDEDHPISGSSGRLASGVPGVEVRTVGTCYVSNVLGGAPRP